MKKTLYLLLMAGGIFVTPVGGVMVNSVESWAGTNKAGWVGYDLINEALIYNADIFSASNGALKLTFPSYLPVKSPFTGKVLAIPMPMPPERYLIKAGIDASGGRFSGDYLSNGVAEVSFRFYCDFPVETWLVIQNEASQRWWQIKLGVQQTGVWKTVTVPIQPSVFRELMGAKDWGTFEQDIRNVSWIGVMVRRNSALEPQTVLVDDFVLNGPGTDYALWMNQFSNESILDNTRNSLPDADLDGDGQNNSSEWIAGTSAGDSNDCLRLSIEQGPQGLPRLRWKTKAGRVYKIWRSTELRQGFSITGGDVPAEAAEATYEEINAPGPVFYRIEARMAP